MMGVKSLDACNYEQMLSLAQPKQLPELVD
jgi:hypothetical protein